MTPRHPALRRAALATLEPLEARRLLAADPLINEFVANHVGADTHEYVEVRGTPDTNYGSYAVVEIDGDGSVAGRVNSVRAVGTTDDEGLWRTAFLNSLQNGTSSLLLVEDATATVNSDLDTDNDGTLDVTPWERVVDDVAVTDGGTSDRTYATVVLAEGFDGGSFTVGGASRIPNGVDTGSAGDWVRNDYDGAGLPGFAGAVDRGEALNTPGVPNTTEGQPPVPPTVRPIPTIQGAGHTSPFVGDRVRTGGVVTALAGNGYYLQDPAGDGDVATSDAIFVFTGAGGTTPAVGDAVRVDGVVAEFTPGGAGTGNLSITQITNGTFTVLGAGNAVPAPMTIGLAGRVPPTQTIDDDGLASFDPATDGIDFYEGLEAMRVQVFSPVVTGSNRFGEISVVTDNGAYAGPRTEAGGVVVTPTDFNPERVIIDDALPGVETPGVNVGDLLAGPVVGVLSYDFGNFKLLATSDVTIAVPTTNAPEVTALAPVGDRLTVATFNVENLDPKVEDRQLVDRKGASNVDDDLGEGKFDALADRIVTNLKSPDVLILEEVQDENGAELPGSTSGQLTADTLIAAIGAAGGPAYEYREVAPEPNSDGGQPGGNIRVGFLFNPARVDFVDRDPGTATEDTDVVEIDNDPALTHSPGRVAPTDPAFEDSRKPLAGEFVFNGQTLFVIGNHFASKGGDDPLFGRNQPPVQGTLPQRLEQADAVADFVREIYAVDPDANVIVAGDLNDFWFSQTLGILEAAGLYNLVLDVPPEDRYTFNFDGNVQALDHMLVSPNLLKYAEPAVDIVHANSDFSPQTRPTDHDPIVGRFTLPEADPTIDVPVTKGKNDVVVRRSGDLLQVTDRTGAVLFSRPLSLVNSLTIDGNDADRDAVTVDLTAGFFTLDDGVRFNGGAGGPNTKDMLKLFAGTELVTSRDADGNLLVEDEDDVLALLLHGVEQIAVT